MRHIPYLVCVLCVQWIAICKRELAQPSITEERRSQLEKYVQFYENHIQLLEQHTGGYNRDLARAVAELGAHESKL